MDTKIDNIVDALIKKSNAGDVIWSLMSNKDGFKLQLKDSTLCIQRRANDGRVVYLLWIYNANGNLIVNQSMDSSITHNRFRDLYESARKVFYKEDATLKSILDQVNAIGKIGEDDNLPF